MSVLFFQGIYRLYNSGPKSGSLRMSNLTNILAKSRPRIIAEQDFSQRVSAAGLLALKAFMAQRALFMKKRNAESLHQMRVSIRRLRTVINILLFVTADDAYKILNDALRNFARILGTGRDQDIFIEMLQQIPLSFYHALDADEKAVYNIIAIRDEAYLRIDKALHDKAINAQFDHLISTFQAQIYSFQPDFNDAPDLDAIILEHLHKIVLKRGRKLKIQDLNQKHRLRIALKTMRYALEFLALNRATNSRAKYFGKQIEHLLAQLGATNDAFTASRIALESLALKDGNTQLMAGMIAGWHGRAVQDHQANLQKSWRKFKSIKPYWA